jgi:hypothetical protein
LPVPRSYQSVQRASWALMYLLRWQLGLWARLLRVERWKYRLVRLTLMERKALPARTYSRLGQRLRVRKCRLERMYSLVQRVLLALKYPRRAVKWVRLGCRYRRMQSSCKRNLPPVQNR